VTKFKAAVDCRLSDVTTEAGQQPRTTGSTEIRDPDEPRDAVAIHAVAKRLGRKPKP
jgi:hypothetical protein